MSELTAEIPGLPTTHTAVKQGDGGILKIQTAPLPELIDPDMVLVKTVTVALNPCDYKMPTRFPCPGASDGSDFAGVIVKLGPSVTRKDLHIGDRVCGAVHASNPACLQSGAFSEYVATFSDLVLKVPTYMTWEDAVAIGGCVHSSVGLALWDSLHLSGHPDNPTDTPEYILIYGGSSASGTMAIQLARCAGMKCITTCSPKNFALVKSYGAEEAFDYNDPECAGKIKAYTGNRLKYVFDVITETKTMKLCYNAMSRVGGKYTGLEYFNPALAEGLRKTVKADWVIGLVIPGKGVNLPSGYGREPSPVSREFGRRWFETVQRLVDAKKIKSHPPRVMDGSFQGILKGVEIMRQREVSGEKLVYFIS